MTQQLRASTAIANSVPRTHIGWFITVCTSSFRIQLLIYKGHYTRVHVDTHTRMHAHRMGMWKRENLSSDTRTHIRSWVLPWMPINPPLQKRDTGASLGLMDHHPGSRFSERFYLKGTRWRQSSLATQASPCTDMDMHRRHTHTKNYDVLWVQTHLGMNASSGVLILKPSDVQDTWVNKHSIRSEKNTTGERIATPGPSQLPLF